MKKIYLSLLAMLTVAFSFATVHTITNSGNTFTPDSLFIQVGDTVAWSVGGSHPVLEVDQADYDTNTNNGNGGFDFPSGVGMEFATFTTAGDYYYICTNHISGGMKGKIVVAAAPPSGANYGPCQDLFISEYIEGGASNKAIEIFNPTNASVDMSEYSLLRFSNGGTSAATINLTGILAPNDVFVVSNNGSSLNAIVVNSDMTSGNISHNGNDAYAFMHGNDTLDILGEVGIDPGSSGWSVGSGDTKDNTLVRIASVNEGTTDWALSSTQWDVYPKDDDTYIGSHTFSPCLVGPVISFKTDSFEFNEADGAIHLDTLLINPAIASPNNESFEVHLGTVTSATYNVDFTISAGPTTLPSFPFTFPITTFTNFTALPLDATLVDDTDIEGEEFVELILRNGINGLNIGADSILWVKITDNDFPADTFVELSSNALTVNEGAASFDIDLDYQQTGTNSAHTVDLMLVTGDAADVDNFTTMTATFNTLTEKFTVNITDDLLVETDEVFTFALTNATNGLFIGSDSIFTLTIEDNDYPHYSIDLLRGNDTDAVADSLNVKCWTSGYILGEDLGSSNREFSIHNGVKGMGVFINSALGDFGYPTITEGDSVMVLGTVSQFGRFSQMSLIDTMYLIGTSTIQTPTIVVDTLGEYTESELITIENAIITGGTWGDNQNITIEANGLEYAVRLDAQTGVGALPEPTGFFNITGLGSQYNLSTSTFYKSYQLKPRYEADIVLLPTLNFNAQGATVAEDAGTTTIDFTVANDNGGSYTVDVALTGGNGTADDIGDFATQTGVVVSGGTGSITVTITDDETIEGNEGFEFTISNPSAGLLIGNANKFELTITDNDADAITEINVNDLKLYPNPATEIVTLDLVSNESQFATLNLYDALGRTVISKTYILNFGNNSIQMSLGDTAKGNYTLEIATEAGKHTEKIMIK